MLINSFSLVVLGWSGYADSCGIFNRNMPASKKPFLTGATFDKAEYTYLYFGRHTRKL